MKLSIIIPAFNEERTILTILKRIANVRLQSVTKEIIIVNDASTDTTDEKIRRFLRSFPSWKYVIHKVNQGKGAAVRTGIKKARGEYIIIQDADLEYHPKEMKKLLRKLAESDAQVVYGSRIDRLPNFKQEQRTIRFFVHYLGNRGLSLITSILYGQYITDMETCYKLIPRRIIVDIPLNAKGFEIEPEITAKLMKRGHKIIETSITAVPRGYEEGKKLHTLKDGYKALRALIKYRFSE